jgi:hypothetical protein
LASGHLETLDLVSRIIGDHTVHVKEDLADLRHRAFSLCEVNHAREQQLLC